MKTLLFLDTETTTVDPTTGRLVEVAIATFSIPFGRHIRSRSWLVRGETNEAEAINGIPVGILAHGDELETVMRQVYGIAVKECDAIVAHSAAFDRAWFTPEIQRLTWVCSCDDIRWPRKSGSRALSAVALAHGVGVVDAHRAGPDVATLVRIFERLHDMGVDIAALMHDAMQPKSLFVAEAPKPWEMADGEWPRLKAQLVDAGFRFESAAKRWERRMRAEEASGLPFSVREVA